MKKINTDIKKNVVNYILNILNLKFGILQNYLANRIYDNNKLFDNFNTTQKNLINIEKKENKSIESIPAKNFANIENYINSISQNDHYKINNDNKNKTRKSRISGCDYFFTKNIILLESIYFIFLLI